MEKLYLAFLIAGFMTNPCFAQKNFQQSEQNRDQLIMYRILGFNFTQADIIDEEELKNATFQKFVKLNVPFSDISFPAIGEFHFRDYDFMDPESGLLKYNYFQATADLTPSLFLFGTENNSANIRLSLEVDVRVWNKRRKPLRSVFEWQASNAIKTPSYKPGIFYSRLVSCSQTPETTKLNYLELGWTHHSNGQDAPTLASQDSTLLLGPDQKYNINDGDFSSNYITFGAHQVRSKASETFFHSVYLVFDGIGTHRPEHEDLIKYQLKYIFKYMDHKTLWIPGCEEMGNHNFELELGFGLVDFNQFDLSQSINYSISYRYKLPWTNKLSFLFSYGYKGQDDYNIFLEHSFHYFRWGLSSLII